MDDPLASSPRPPEQPVRPDRHPDDLPPFEHERRSLPSGLIWAGVLFVVVLAIASWQALSSTESPNPTPPGEVVRLDNNVTLPSNGGLTGVNMVGRPVPSAAYTTFDGRQASLAGHAGKPIVVNFWSSTCPPCITEMPDFEKVHQAYGDRVVFVGFDTVDGENPARTLAVRTGVTYELGFDRDGAIAKSFGVINLPSTFLITRDGQIVYGQAGARTADELTKQIEEKLAP